MTTPTTTTSETPGRDRIEALKRIRPDVNITVDRERDVFMSWDGDGPHPADEGFVCYDWSVTATCIRNGEVYEGEVHLGGSWYAPDDESDTAKEIGGYLPQMIEEALDQLDANLLGAAPQVEPPQVIHTSCKHCALDIEGLAPFPAREWRDRGNNTTCAVTAERDAHWHEPSAEALTGHWFTIKQASAGER